MELIKSCAVCKNIRFVPGQPYYSDVTPGSDSYIRCEYARLPELTCGYIDLFSELRTIASSCKFFDPEVE